MTDLNRLTKIVSNLLLFTTLAGASIVFAAVDSVAELAAPQDVSFKAKWDGSEQRYVVRLPVDLDRNKPHDLLIALHGHGSDRWQFTNDPRDECRSARDAASKNQMIFVSPDYRARTSWMGPAAEADLLQIIDDLHHIYRIDNVIICGGSMGGTSALAFATLHPECVDGVMSMNGTANLVQYEGFADAITASYGGTKVEKPEVYRTRSAELFPERLTMPIGLTTGGRDTIVPPDSTLRLANHLTPRHTSFRHVHRPEGGHDTTYADGIETLQFVIDAARSHRGFSKPLLTFDGEPKTIVCLGDSVTGVYYHTGGRRAYPEMLQVGLNQLFPNSRVTVINAGISGQTTQNGLERLEQDVLGKHPDLVTISFCLNDVTRIPPETFRANLQQLINRCRERQSQVLLCTPNAVIDTAARPIEKLIAYCEILREVGKQKSVPVCDQYLAGNRLKSRAPWTWRLTMSDEIHPNMDGHKRMAEELCRSIVALPVSLDSVTPPAPSLTRVKTLLNRRQPVRILAMPPYDGMISAKLKDIRRDAEVVVTPWIVAGKSMAELEKEANQLVRAMKPDLVVLAVPRDAAAESDEQFVRSFSWIMNWSLSFGLQEWDCIVVHPSVAEPDTRGLRDDLARKLVRAQHLDLIDRDNGEQAAAAALFADWIRKRMAE